MKPFYSIRELADLLGQPFYDIAGGLIAYGVPMVCEGVKTTDISSWKNWSSPVISTGDRSIVVVTGRYPVPNPEHVIVSSDALPDSWIQSIDGNTMAINEKQDALSGVTEKNATLDSALRNEQALKRHRELNVAGNKAPTKALSAELGVSARRIRQYLEEAREAERTKNKSLSSFAGQLTAATKR